MGIKNLKKFLRENYPQTIKSIHITDFSNEKIAVDISAYIYKYKAVFGDDGWLNCFPGLICALKKFNVHAVFIFDGKPPPEKDNEREKRRKVRDDLEDNVMNLSIELDIYKDTQNVTPLLVDVMEKIAKNNKNTSKVKRMLHAGKDKNTTTMTENHIDINAIEEYIKKKEKQIVNISNEDISDIKKMLELFGVPYIQAQGEAEALGAYLCVNDKVKAVLTEDTDVLVYGTSTFISDFDTSSGNCEVIYLADVLESLDYTLLEFLDFCIMCGTDYNKNIPKYASGKVFKIINTHRNIDVFIEEEDKKKNPLDYKILNHLRGRELFLTFGNLDTNSICLPKYWETNIDFDVLYDFLKMKNCRFSASTITELWEPSELVFSEDECDKDELL